MNEISVVGVDLAKRIFHLCALSEEGEVVWSKRMGRLAFMRFMETKAPRCLIGMEACGGAHYWGRWLQARDIQVKLMAPRSVKAFLSGPHKNDARDAHAIAEAASRPFVATIRVKSAESQAVQALIRVRERCVHQRVQTANQLRGLLNEFGITCPKGYTKILERVTQAKTNGTFEDLPIQMQQLVDDMCIELREQAARVNKVTQSLNKQVSEDTLCRRLTTIPHIGPINAAALSVALSTPQAFRSGRAFASYLRLVPRQNASADKNRLKGIGKQAPISSDDIS